jgi:hypothetical protein
MILKDLIGSVRTLMKERNETPEPRRPPREWKQPTPSDTFIREPGTGYVPMKSIRDTEDPWQWRYQCHWCTAFVSGDGMKGHVESVHFPGVQPEGTPMKNMKGAVYTPPIELVYAEIEPSKPHCYHYSGCQEPNYKGFAWCLKHLTAAAEDVVRYSGSLYPGSRERVANCLRYCVGSDFPDKLQSDLAARMKQIIAEEKRGRERRNRMPPYRGIR